MPKARATSASPLPLEWWNVCTRGSEMWWTREMGREAIAAAAARRTRGLIDFARAHSPFYRRIWAGFAAETGELRELPVVTKPQLMSHFDNWLTDRNVDLKLVTRFLRDRSHIGEPLAGKYLVWKSSGSSGEPGIYLQDPAALAVYDALLGMQLGAMELASTYAWGLLGQGGRAALVAATGDHFASIASWERVCRGMPWPSARAFSVATPLPDLVSQLNEFQPAFLASYPTTLIILADEQRAGRLRISPACLWSGGEYLSQSSHAAVESAFKSRLVNEYGASEFLSIAYSCRYRNLHVNAEWVVLEPVDRDYEPTPAGEPSHTVLLTNLANRIQPLVRYDLGDSVTAYSTPCRCGSPLPWIRVDGRRDDVLCLRAPDDRAVRVPPLALTTAMEEATGKHRFQIVQTSPDSIDIRIEARDPRTRAVEWHAAKKALAAFFAGQSLPNVRLRLASESPEPDPRSGKLREVLARPRGAEMLAS
jgi:phenylacetate-coenzyme A ligase PaaK-like adenylate-forming protein